MNVKKILLSLIFEPKTLSPNRGMVNTLNHRLNYKPKPTLAEYE